MRILAIETSCDDTGVAIIESDKKSQPVVLADLVSSQVKIHAPWGGVVPTLAKREHQKNLLPLFKKALVDADSLKIKKSKLKIEGYSDFIKNPRQGRNNAKLKILNKILEREPELLKKLLPFLEKYQKSDIDLIAVTIGPGLEPALWVGVNFAKALGYFWNLAVMPINHIEGHIIANWFNDPVITSPALHEVQDEVIPWQPTKNRWHLVAPRRILQCETLRNNARIEFPALCLVVSGGHTQLILARDFNKYEIIGETRDDAAGEAFDKVAKMLGLAYPGGPAIAKEAAKFKVCSSKFEVHLPRPMLNSPDFDFSFSGLKTATLYFIKGLRENQLKQLTPAIAAEFQQAVIDVLVAKTLAAAKKYDAKTIMLSGGVAANDLLRKTLRLKTIDAQLNFLAPPKNLCTDNALMVALTAYMKIEKSKTKTAIKSWRKIAAQANLRLA